MSETPHPSKVTPKVNAFAHGKGEEYYLIEPMMGAVRSKGPVPSKQRTSSLFAEAPRIGSVTLRRGSSMKMNEAQFQHNKVLLKRLWDAHAIKISRVDEDGSKEEFERESHLPSKKTKEDLDEDLKEQVAPVPAETVATKPEEPTNTTDQVQPDSGSGSVSDTPKDA